MAADCVVGEACINGLGNKGTCQLDKVDGTQAVCIVDSWQGTPSNAGEDCTKADSPCINWAGNDGICVPTSSGFVCEVVPWDDSNKEEVDNWWNGLWSPDENSDENGKENATTEVLTCDNGFEKIAGVCMPKSEITGLSDASVLDILTSLLSWLMALFTILSIMAFVVSGIQYLVSVGDSGMIDVAKRNMTWSVVGIIVGLSGYLVLKAIVAALAGEAIF